MPRLIVVDRAGVEQSIDAKSGHSIMEVLRDNGVDQLLALCGGCCSCATCHVYIDPSFGSRLADATPAENDLLDGSDHRTAQSRLSCQIVFSDVLDGIRLIIAPED